MATQRGREGHVLLLGALLRADPAKARNDWYQWLDAVRDPVTHLRSDTSGLRRLSPLLLNAAKRNGLPIEGAFLTTLRSAYFREELRTRALRGILTPLLAALHAEKSRVILVNGVALAHSVYPDPVLRHCHDIDLYCSAFETEDVASLLIRLGYREAAVGAAHMSFTHASGLLVELHHRLLGLNDTGGTFAAVYARSRRLEIDGNPVHILAPENALIQICARGLAAGVAARPGLVCDAWMLLNHGPRPDWRLVLKAARGNSLPEDLENVMTFLSDELGANVPRWAIDAISGRNRAEMENASVKPTSTR